MVGFAPTCVTQDENNTIKPVECFFGWLVVALLADSWLVKFGLTLSKVHPTRLTHGVSVRLVCLFPHASCGSDIAKTARHSEN